MSEEPTKYYEPLITVRVLGESPIDEPSGPEEMGRLMEECNTGHCVGELISHASREVTANHMAEMLAAAGSEAGFFQIDDIVHLPEGGAAEFEPYSDKILELPHLAAVKPGNGWGTEAMQLITSLADKWKVPLMVLPAGVNKAASQRLEEFYRRFGFEGEDALHRSPE